MGVRKWLRRRRRKKRRSFRGSIFNPLPQIDVNQGTNGQLSFYDDEATVQANPNFNLRILIPIIRNNGDVGAVSATVEAIDGTAVNGVDYQFTSPQVASWQAGQSGSVAVAVTLLTFPTQDKTFTLRISNPTGGASIGTFDEIEITIQAVPGPAGQVGFLQQVFNENENTLLAITVHRFDGTDGAISVDYQLFPSTAQPGVNYVDTSGTLFWANGDDTPQTIVIQLLGVIGPPFVDFIVQLSNPTGGVFLSAQNNPATVNIYQVFAGQPGSLAHELTLVQQEESTVLSLRVKRLGGSTGAVGCSRATSNITAIAGSNYTATSGSLSWGDGDLNPQSVPITIGAVGPGQLLSFLHTISVPTGGAALLSGYETSTIYIVDNGLPPPAPITELLVDEIFLFDDDALIDDMSFDSDNVHVIWANALHNGFLGFQGGTESFGGGTDLANADDSLLPSPPLRFQIYEMIETEPTP